MPEKQFGQKIGLITFQNGIQNTFDDFKDMGLSILNKLPFYKGLAIGLYNSTKGIVYGLAHDYIRLNNEWYLNEKSILVFRQLISTLTNCLPKHALWTHIAHSEAGLIANQVIGFETNPLPFSDEIKKFMKERLITLTYGAVAPVPNHVKLAINTYSRDDVVMRYASVYLDIHPSPLLPADDELEKQAEDLIENPYLATPENIQKLFNKLKAERDRKAAIYKTNPGYIVTYPHNCEKKDCSLTIVEREIVFSEKTLSQSRFVSQNKSVPPLPFIKKDHDFAGATYQRELESNIKFLQKEKFL